MPFVNGGLTLPKQQLYDSSKLKEFANENAEFDLKLWKGIFGHWCKLSSRISLCSPHSLIQDGTL